MNVHQSNLMRGMMLIGGELVPSEGGEWLESVNPATEETLGHVPQGTVTDVNRAVAAAEAAHPGWAAHEPKERAKLVKRLAAKLREKTDEILRVEVVDTGNTITKMRADVASAGDTLDFYAGFHTEIKARRSRRAARTCISPFASPMAWSAASFRSIIRSSSPPTRLPRR
jgi:acyl-CoA reductase-like NAD-dependent aldehyde dehydrogenase